MVLTAVFLLSFSTLAFEVLLARVFSITQWNHLAFMVISIALFGFAAAGTFFSILDVRRPGWEVRMSMPGPLSAIVLLFSVTALIALVVIDRLPLDYFRLPLEPMQAIYLLTTYLLLALPFFFSGMAVSLAYAAAPGVTGRVYWVTMVGSAAGALFPVGLLPLLAEDRLVVVTALVPLAWFASPAALRALTKPPVARHRPVSLVAAGVVLAAAALLAGTGAFELRPSPYKDLSQLLMFPDTRITDRTTTIRGRIETVESPYIRFAPGQSLTFSGKLPRQKALFTDGEQRLVLYDDSDRLAFDFCRYSLPYAGYILTQDVDPVLIVAQNGGSAVACALAAGAREIIALATDPARARALAAHYGLPSVDQGPRVFLAGSAQRFAVIHIDDWGPTIPGTAALDEGHLLTVDAFDAYLDHLAAHGRIIVSRHLLLPPADTVRLYAAAWEALEARGAENPSQHLALIRNFDSFTLLVSATPLPIESPLHQFVRRMNFDWIFAPGIERRDANRFNRFEMPFHFDTVAGLERAHRDGTSETFLSAYPLDAAPQSDYRPYPHRFLKWTRAAEIYRSTGRRMYALLLSGEIVVAVLLAQAVVVATFLLVPAIWAIRGRRPRAEAAQVVFFAGVGAGFMFVELFYIKAFALLFGNPVISLAVVLAGLLVASGIGGLCSERLERGWLPKVLGALTVWLGACAIGLFPLMHALLGYSGPLRCAAAVMVMMPAGILMGVVFSIGMRCLPRGPGDRVVAWTANGCLSVVSAIGAAQIALSLGIPAVLGFAIAGYLTAWIAVRRASA